MNIMHTHRRKSNSIHSVGNGCPQYSNTWRPQESINLQSNRKELELPSKPTFSSVKIPVICIGGLKGFVDIKKEFRS